MRVENQVEVVAVGFDLGMVYLGEGVFDGQLVEVKDVGEDPRLLRSGRAQVDPHPDPAARRQRRREENGSTRSTIWVDPFSCL